MEEIQDIEDLVNMGFKVDILPNGLRKGIMFQLSGYTYLHIRDKICIIVNFDDEEIILPQA